MTTFQYSTTDTTKHTLQIVEKDDIGMYHVIVDGVQRIVDQKWINNLIICRTDESLSPLNGGKTLING